MLWYQDDDEEENLMFSPALMARRASESWIDTPPVEVDSYAWESGDADFVATQEITARFSGSAEGDRCHVEGGGVLSWVGAQRGGSPPGRRERTTSCQSAPLPSQSASEGLALAPTAGDCSALHQYIAGHHVLQATNIVQAGRQRTRVSADYPPTRQLMRIVY
ncbi:uncharacterized protein LOC123012418 isoform X3 [Tribolium madens]|uniref:uncharacterized protein LOC123012418 isoform X3 n=1 Tax=Tribolium madens TaxID=41895 RepID=UPI001CF73835|nr:uncharacterized protein LOC123012418 isoform X3 [Tribolium madens]